MRGAPLFVALSLSTCVAMLTSNVSAQIAGGALDPTAVPKFQEPMVMPPAMPPTDVLKGRKGTRVIYYEIAMQQFEQDILPPSMGLPPTTVWSYGSVNHPETLNYPAFTIEARWRQPVRVKWINGLVDENGRYLPHLLPVDQTLHWANPAGPRDARGFDPMPYTGPVPMVTHLHGGETAQESDGYPEAWWLPRANNIPDGMYNVGTLYKKFRRMFRYQYRQRWDLGSAVYQYDNDQAAATLWYHDHALGITRLNVYAGPAGFYILRGGPGDRVVGVLPGDTGGAMGGSFGGKKDDPNGGIPTSAGPEELHIVIQDRSFNGDGSLFYPDNRAFFEGLDPSQLQIPFIPDDALAGPSDVSPIWNPEFFGNTMVVNGRTWPYQVVEARRYRLRLLNGCNSRFLILELDGGLPFHQIGSDGGFLDTVVTQTRMLLGPAERADVIVDFTDVPAGTNLLLRNLGPDDPFGGGEPGLDFDPSDPGTTGQVMQFRVIPASGPDMSTPPADLVLPDRRRLGAADVVRRLSLNEEESHTVFASEDADGNVVEDPVGLPFGPTSALLGTLNDDGTTNPLTWADEITENPPLGATEIWEIHNFTADAHPIHLHLVQFEVMEREDVEGVVRDPEEWERGPKDTVIAYPGQITRIKARFDLWGLYVWHCHILEHEDNEMMRPYFVGRMPGNPDVNGDGVVDFSDIIFVLRHWGDVGGPADANDDGIVNFGDLIEILLAMWR